MVSKWCGRISQPSTVQEPLLCLAQMTGKGSSLPLRACSFTLRAVSWSQGTLPAARPGLAIPTCRLLFRSWAVSQALWFLVLSYRVGGARQACPEGVLQTDARLKGLKIQRMPLHTTDIMQQSRRFTAQSTFPGRCSASLVLGFHLFTTHGGCSVRLIAGCRMLAVLGSDWTSDVNEPASWGLKKGPGEVQRPSWESRHQQKKP